MKIIKTAIAIITVITFAGCTTPCSQSFSAQMSKLQQGMSKSQVIQLLGKPSEAGTGAHYSAPNVTISDGFSEVFRYTRNAGKQSKDWLVVFVGGKVTEYGPFVGDLQARYGAVFSNK